MARAHWDGAYQQRGEQELSWYQERPATSLRLVASTGAGRGARLVDVGGGASRLVDALLEEGFGQLAVLDISAVALERARTRLGSRAAAVTWIASDVATWTPDALFDVWHDRAVFHFLVTEEERAAYRTTLRRALVSGGQAVIATFASDGPDRCSGLPVVRYEPETLAVELGPPFELVEGVREDHVTPGGKVQRFQYSRLVRR